MTQLYVKKTGVWSVPTQVYANNGGVWTPAIAVWRRTSGTWTKFWPYVPPGSWTQTVPGIYSFIVPAYVHNITATIIGSGGGGGSCDSDGDAWVGSGGGSGGIWSLVNIATTPGETLTVTVARKGYGASYRLNSTYVWNYDNLGVPVAVGTGQNGHSSMIQRGATILYEATGGAGGCQQCFGGVGGLPDGGPGCRGSSPTYLGPGFTGSVCGGINGSGYGDGGGDAGLVPGSNGKNGAVFLYWG